MIFATITAIAIACGAILLYVSCVNTELRITPQGEVGEYCALYKNGKKPRHVWVTDDFIDCLDKKTSEVWNGRRNENR